MIEATDCVLVLGTRGTGKSFLGKNLQKLWPRRVVIDTLDEYDDEANSVFSFDEFSKKMVSLERENPEGFVVVVKFDPEQDQDSTEFNEILRICYYFGGVQVVVEEIQMFSTPHELPKWLRNALLTGRHQGLSLLFTSQRPGEVNKTILSQCNHIFVGRIVEGNDVRYLAGFLNQSAERLSSLPDRRFLYFNRGNVIEVENTLVSVR